MVFLCLFVCLCVCPRVQLAGERVVRDLRRSLFASLLARPVAFYDGARTGELLTRLSADAGLVGKSITGNLLDGTRSVLQASVGTQAQITQPPPTFLSHGVPAHFVSAWRRSYRFTSVC
jgi:ABC-type multidrug transport system fused ATPase/permease subunit